MPTPAPATSSNEGREPPSADAGKRRIEWAFVSMPVLQGTRKQFIRDQPFAGTAVALCVHLTPEAANLAITIRDGGAAVVLRPADAATTQEDVTVALERDYGIRTVTDDELLASAPQLLMDNGAALISLVLAKGADLRITGAVEGTSRGAKRIRGRGDLPFPVIGVTHRYGAGQSTIDAILQTTGLLLAGSTVVVAGFGRSGRSVAARARGLGASVVVAEVDAGRALEAALEGFRVMTMADAAPHANLVITSTGSRSVISRDSVDRLRDGAILANAGHPGAEIDIESLARAANSRRIVREHVEEFKMKDGRRLYVLAGGRPVNPAVSGGHPASAMDLSFACEALSAAWLCENALSLGKGVSPVPLPLMQQVARMKLDAMGIAIDRLTIEQEKYLSAGFDPA